MSILQNPVRRRPFTVQPGLSHLLLLCRFDFRQKIWELPGWEISRAAAAVSPADSGSLASAVSRYSSHFSDPSLGGVRASRTARRRIGLRHSLRRSLGKTKNKKQQRKNEN
jgi:hypothetical protein